MPTLTTYRSIATMLWLFVGGLAGLTLASTINVPIRQFPFYIILTMGIVFLAIVTIPRGNIKNDAPDYNALVSATKKKISVNTKASSAPKTISKPNISSEESARQWLDDFLQNQQKNDSK